MVGIDDSKWPEVEMINSYATFVGLLMLGVRGLGVLIITWTTVVLLGGFVSMLEKKDFWCLTIITLVQTARVFNLPLNENASDIAVSFNGSLWIFVAIATSLSPVQNFIDMYAQDASHTCVRTIAYSGLSAALLMVRFLLYLLSVFLAMVHWVVLGFIFFPIAVLYLFGLYISTGISYWRLNQNDYGNGDGMEKMKPALDVLYLLAVAQGVCFFYKTIHTLVVRTRLAKEVAKKYSSLGADLVSAYLDETMIGCMKNPSFARGRNLITYSVDMLLESKSHGCFSFGVRILVAIIGLDDRMEVLTGLPSFNKVIQILLETLDPRSGYRLEIRKDAARVVANVAHIICLDQFPGGIWFISSLLYHENKSLTEIGLSIFEKLTVYEDNCIIIGNTEGVVTKIMGPLISEQFHMVRHDEWRSMAKRIMELMRRLIVSPGTTGTKLAPEISSNNNRAIISTFESIVKCHGCEVMLKREAVEILLLYLPMERSSFMITTESSNSSRIIFLGILLHIFLLPDGCNHLVTKDTNVRILAAENMQAVLSLQSGRTDKSMLESVGVVISSLARIILLDARKRTYRVHATHILEHLCEYYTTQDEYLKELTKAVVDVMSKVLQGRHEYCGSTCEQTHVQFSGPGIDIEKGGVWQSNDLAKSSSSQQQNVDQHHDDNDSELREALIALCKKTRSRWACGDQDLKCWLDEITAKTCSADRGIRNFEVLARNAEEHLKKAKRLATPARS